MAVASTSTTVKSCIDFRARVFRAFEQSGLPYHPGFFCTVFNDTSAPNGANGFVLRAQGEFDRATGLHQAADAAYRIHNWVFSIDSDIDIRPRSIWALSSLLVPEQFALFPVVFGFYNSRVVELARRINAQADGFGEEAGRWKTTGYGMGVISRQVYYASGGYLSAGAGWGGEDDSFFRRVSKVSSVLRVLDTGLLHHWHRQRCEGIESDAKRKACIRVKLLLLGGPIGKGYFVPQRIVRGA